jgi:hypothetical protein
MVHVKNEPPADDSLMHDLLVAEGYKLVEDAWKEFGRRTYLHDDDANKDYIKALARRLQSAGWQTDTRKLRTFRHPGSNHLEPGGSEASLPWLIAVRARAGQDWTKCPFYKAFTSVTIQPYRACAGQGRPLNVWNYVCHQ